MIRLPPSSPTRMCGSAGNDPSSPSMTLASAGRSEHLIANNLPTARQNNETVNLRDIELQTC